MIWGAHGSPSDGVGQNNGRGRPENNARKTPEHGEVTSPAKKKTPRGLTKPKPSQGAGKGNASRGQSLTGQKRKTQKMYRPIQPLAQSAGEPPVLAIMGPGEIAPLVEEASEADEASGDSNKKLRRNVEANSRSADQAGVVQQPRHTQ
jgi:hypothetical protein